MSADSYFDWVIRRFHPPISRNFLSNQKDRGPKCMRVFISRLYLIYSRRNSRFPAEIASLLFEALLQGIVWAHQWFGAFLPRLDIHSKTEFSCLHPIIIEFWIEKIQAGIRQTCTFRTPLGRWSCSHHMVDNVGRLIFDWLIPRSYPPISRNFLSNQKDRGPKCMRVFILRIYLIYRRRNSRFPAEIASLLFEALLQGIVWAHQWFGAFLPRLDIHSKTEFSCLHPIIIEFWIEKFRLE